MEADAEAGGSAPARGEIAAAHRQETRNPPHSPNVVRESGGGYWLGVFAVGLALALAVFWLILEAP